jgi:hypothetical protein
MQVYGAIRTPHYLLYQNRRDPRDFSYSFYHGATLNQYLSYKWEPSKKKSFPTWRFPSDQSLLNLPAELLHKIVGYCNTPPVLWTLMQTCSTLRETAKPLFWNNTVWFTESSSRRNAICPVVASQVRQLIIEDLPPAPTTVKQCWDSLQAAFPNLRAVCLLKFIPDQPESRGRPDLPKAFTALEFLTAYPQGIDMYCKLEYETDVMLEPRMWGYKYQKLSPDGSWEIVRLKKGIHWVHIPPPAAPLGDFERFQRDAGIQQIEKIAEQTRSRIRRIGEIHGDNSGTRRVIGVDRRRHTIARKRRRQLWDQIAEKWGEKGSDKRRRYEAAFLKQLEQDPFSKEGDIRESWLWKDLQREMDGFKFPEFER